MDQLWGKALETLITRSPELGTAVFVVFAMWKIVQMFLSHLATHEASRRADQAACHEHQERMTDKMETAFGKVSEVVDKNTSALARVELRLSEPPPRGE